MSFGRPKLRPKTVGEHHALIAGLYKDVIEGTESARQRSALGYLCTHLDAQGRLLGEDAVLHEVISDRAFRDKQRALFGTSRQTLNDLALNARSAVHHDRLDHLAATVDWYGRTVQAAKAGLQGWSDAHEREDLDRVLGIASDAGRPDLARCLYAFEAWYLSAKGIELPDPLVEAIEAPPDIDKQSTPYRVLAAQILKAAGVQQPPWSLGLEPWSHVTLPVHAAPEAGWPKRALDCVIEGTESPSVVAQGLSHEGPSDWGRLVAILLTYLETIELSESALRRVAQLLEGLSDIDWEDIAAKDAITAMGPTLCDRLLAVGFQLVPWWRGFLKGITSDYRGAAHAVLQHIYRLSIHRPCRSAVIELSLDWVSAFPEAFYRRRLIAECPGLISEELLAGRLTREECYPLLRRLVDIESSAIPEVTSDNLMFGIGRALGARGDKASVHTAFAKIQNPWIKGQILRVQEPSQIANLDLSALPADLTNPLAQCFSLAHIFTVISPTCSIEEMETGLKIAAACEPYPEVRISGLEGVLSGLGARQDHAEVLKRLWRHHNALLELAPGYRWRLLSILFTGGATPQDCPQPLRAWVEASLASLSDTQRDALASLPAGPSWDLKARVHADITAGAKTTQLRHALLATPPRLDEAQAYDAEWTAQEWVLWTNSLAIAAPAGLTGLHPEVAAYLANRIGPAAHDASSTFSLLELVARAGEALSIDGPWSDTHQRLAALARSPETFTPKLEARLNDPECWGAVMDWMSRGSRSEILVREIQAPAVRAWLKSQQEWVTRSEYGRLYPIVKYPERALLSWLTLMSLDGIRPAQMLIAELLTRSASDAELAQLRQVWLATAEEAA